MTLFSMGRRAVDKRISLHFSMDRILFYLLTFSIIISWNQKAWAQIVVLDSFNPPETSSICGIGIDLKRDNIWIYQCLGDSLYSYSTSDNLISAVLRPGERAAAEQRCGCREQDCGGEPDDRRDPANIWNTG